MKFMDSIGIKRFVSKILEVIGNKVARGEWLSVMNGYGKNAVQEHQDCEAGGDYSHAEGYKTTAKGQYSHAEGSENTAEELGSHAEGSETTARGQYSHAEGAATTANGNYSHAEGSGTTASGNFSHSEGFGTTTNGELSHAEGKDTTASGFGSHAEGISTIASGFGSHAEGSCNYEDVTFIHTIGVGFKKSNTKFIKRNAVVIYVARKAGEPINPTAPKNGYQYLLGVGGYKGQAIEDGMKSIQEVIADLESRITALENR